jgi:hypothetical protein
VAVPQRVDGDARGEVEVGVAVRVPEGGPLSPDEDDVGAGVGLEDVAVVGGGLVWVEGLVEGGGREEEEEEEERLRGWGMKSRAKKKKNKKTSKSKSNSSYRFSSSTTSLVNSSALLTPRAGDADGAMALDGWEGEGVVDDRERERKRKLSFFSKTHAAISCLDLATRVLRL